MTLSTNKIEIGGVTPVEADEAVICVDMPSSPLVNSPADSQPIEDSA